MYKQQVLKLNACSWAFGRKKTQFGTGAGQWWEEAEMGTGDVIPGFAN